MKKKLKKLIKCDQKVILLFILLIFVLSLIPILYLSGYVHATGDDYGYGKWTHLAWLSSHSIWETLKAAANTSVMYWHSWQGTWFTIFLMSLQPEVFSPNGYWIVPWVILGINIFCTSLLTWYFMVKKLELSKITWIAADLLLLFSAIQYFPSTKSGIFWWNGAVHYIVPYCLALLAVCAFFRYADTAKKRYLFMACVCMFCLGGSSYLALLFALIVLFYLLICEGSKKRRLFWLLIPAGIELAGFVVSFLSPGNKKRGGEEFGIHGTMIISTILDCFQEGTRTALEYLQEYPVVFLIFLVIAMLVLEGFCKQKSTWKFPLPLLFFASMFCLYCAMFAPQIYAGVEVSGGVPNTIYQVFLLTFFADIVYGMGWLAAKWKAENKEVSVFQIRCVFLPLCCIGLLLVFMQKGTLKDMTVYECYDYISSGQADDYKAQMEERLAILMDPAQMDIELPAMNPDQGPLMHMEIMEDPDAWTNKVLREFYQKDRIVQVSRK